MVGVPASAHSSEATVKIAMPMTKIRRRPKRSASEPPVSSIAASVSAYASITHCRSAKSALRSRSIAGSATFTIVMSSSSMKVAIAHHDEGPPLAIHDSHGTTPAPE